MTIDVSLEKNHGPARRVTAEGASQEEWLEARAQGVTASEVHSIASGGRSTWKRILDDKLNGSTFRGNQHTRRGHEREPVLLEYVRRYAANTVEPNAALWAHSEYPRHLATPDAISAGTVNGALYPFGVEVKSHAYGWTRADIPAEHVDQMQWGMWVLGSRYWVYVFEVMGDDGLPTLEDPTLIVVDRDEARIAQLVAQAEAFLAWRDAGAPEDDGLPPEIDEAIAKSVDAKTRRLAAIAEEKPANEILKKWAASREGAATAGVKVAGSAGNLRYTTKVNISIDEVALLEADPERHAFLLEKRVELAGLEEKLREAYPLKEVSETLTISAHKAVKK